MSQRDPKTTPSPTDVIAHILRQHGYDQKPWEPDILAPRIIERLRDAGYFIVPPDVEIERLRGEMRELRASRNAWSSQALALQK